MDILRKLREVKNNKCIVNRILIVGTDPRECAMLLKAMTSMNDFNVVVIDFDTKTHNGIEQSKKLAKNTTFNPESKLKATEHSDDVALKVQKDNGLKENAVNRPSIAGSSSLNPIRNPRAISENLDGIKGSSMEWEGTRNTEVSQMDSYKAMIPNGCIVVETRRRMWYRGYVWDFFTSYREAYVVDRGEVNTIYDVNVIIFIADWCECSNKFENVTKFFKLNSENSSVKILIVNLNGNKDISQQYHLDKHFGLHDVIILDKIDSYHELAQEILNTAIKYTKVESN